MCEPADLSQWGECLVLFSYPRERALAYRNAAIKEKAVIGIYKGCNLGYTECIPLIEGNWDDRKCIGLMHFDTAHHTKRWLEGDQPFKQPDFLSPCEILIMPLQQCDMTLKGYPLVEIISINGSFKDLTDHKYLTDLTCLVHDHGGIPLVVCQEQPWKWRAVETPGSMIINEWPNYQTYEHYCATDKAKSLEEIRKSIGTGYKIAVELITDM